MLSKVLAYGESSAHVQPISWRNSSHTNGPRVEAAASHFEPSVSLDHETVMLRNRILELEQSARQAVDSARRQAFAEGEARGQAQARAECEPILEKMAASLGNLADLRPRLRDQAEADVVQLALAIARRILHREISVDPGAIQALVQVALERLARQEVHRVCVHPAQAAPIRAALAAHHREFQIHEDGRLEPGALIFETNRGKMDASITAQFEEIERGLTDRVQQR